MLVIGREDLNLICSAEYNVNNIFSIRDAFQEHPKRWHFPHSKTRIDEFKKRTIASTNNLRD